VRAAGYTIWELFTGVEIGRARLSLTVDNFFDASWNEAQFATTSRLRGETTPITELNYTPGAPRSVQLGVTYRFY
jgi:outer membrane receptor protein involved in Fe transport